MNKIYKDETWCTYLWAAVFLLCVLSVCWMVTHPNVTSYTVRDLVNGEYSTYADYKHRQDSILVAEEYGFLLGMDSTSYDFAINHMTEIYYVHIGRRRIHTYSGKMDTIYPSLGDMFMDIEVLTAYQVVQNYIPSVHGDPPSVRDD